LLAGLVLSPLISIISGLYRFCLRPSPNLATLAGQESWACVTGATDGIGKAYAIELAKRGMPVLLISRTQSKLDEVKAEIEADYGVQAETYACDMSAGPAIYAGIEAFLASYQVGLLVNNVGASYEHAEYLHMLDREKLHQLLNMNVETVTIMSHMVLPGMVARKRGAIVNVASWLGVYPCGLYAVYSASKAYVDFFAQSLAQEYAPLGITVQSVLPQFVVSKLSKLRKPSLTIPLPEDFASSALQTLGFDSRTTGYWSQDLQWALACLFPARSVEAVLWKLHHGIYLKAYKKKARMAAEQH
jgi:17beta-estradiol 17-dehydrogenase / very-long-chain 3-oxoacyl-CoA reductase